MQHIALRTEDIIKSVSNLAARGQQFLTIPKNYYTLLRENLKHSKVNIAEDMDIVSYNTVPNPSLPKPRLHQEIFEKNCDMLCSKPNIEF